MIALRNFREISVDDRYATHDTSILLLIGSVNNKNHCVYRSILKDT